MVRVKKRYLTLHFERATDVSKATPASLTASLPLSDASICSSIRAAVQELHGDFGQAAVSLGMRSAYCNADTHVAVLQVRHGPHRLVASAIPFVSKIADQKVIVTLIYTGGTIRHCYKVNYLDCCILFVIARVFWPNYNQAIVCVSEA
jgi:ribonuclease P/MRP protein subunit POP5